MELSTEPEKRRPREMARHVTLLSCLTRVWAHVMCCMFHTCTGQGRNEVFTNPTEGDLNRYHVPYQRESISALYISQRCCHQREHDWNHTSTCVSSQ